MKPSNCNIAQMTFYENAECNLTLSEKNEQSKFFSQEISIFSFLNISNANEPMKFILYTTSVFIFFLLYGFLQELIFRLEGFQPYGFYLTLLQFLFYILFSSFERFLRNEGNRKIPLKLYAVLAVLTVGTMGFSNASVGYLNYPTQVVFKCCKLVPVLIGGILIQGKKYVLLDFLAAILMSLGLTLFTLADSKISPNFNIIGIALITTALVADAAIGNAQEKMMKEYFASNSEMVFYSYAIGFIYIFLVLICLGQLRSAFEFCALHPFHTYGYGFLFSLSGYCGINLVLSMVRHYGAFTTVTVTTCRKALTIVISFIVFSKPFTFQYLWSGLIIVCGIYLNAYNKLQNKQKYSLWILIKKLYEKLYKIGILRRKDRKLQDISV